MNDLYFLLGAFAFCGAVVFGIVKLSRRGQQKMKKEAEEGWEEASRKH